MINDDLILHMDNINNGHYGHIQCMEGRYFDILSICILTLSYICSIVKC